MSASGVLADHVAQSRLGGPVDRRDVISDVERRHFRIDNLPEQHRVEVAGLTAH
jgi:hypothetical protein